MRKLFLTTAIFTVAGCVSIPPVYLKHLDREEVVQCGPYTAMLPHSYSAEQECVQDYQRQGFAPISALDPALAQKH